jgi:hypothetical protein
MVATTNPHRLFDMRRQWGMSTRKQMAGESQRGRSESDPLGFALAVEALRDRWRNDDLPAMQAAAELLMRLFRRTREYEDQEAWYAVEGDILDCQIALGDIEELPSDRRPYVRQAMRDRAKRARMNIPRVRVDGSSRRIVRRR